MKQFISLALVCALAFTIVACGDKDANNKGNVNTENDGAAQQNDSNESGQGAGNDLTDPNAPVKQEVKDLPETIEIEVMVEGMADKRTGTLVKNDNGYYLYTLPFFKFTGEEPGVDQLYMESFPDYFLRIQNLGASANLDELKGYANEQLKELGEVKEWAALDIGDAEIGKAKFYLSASSNQMSQHIWVLDIDGQMFKFTAHIPVGEASEGAIPGFYAIVKTIGLQ